LEEHDRVLDTQKQLIFLEGLSLFFFYGFEILKKGTCFYKKVFFASASGLFFTGEKFLSSTEIFYIQIFLRGGKKRSKTRITF